MPDYPETLSKFCTAETAVSILSTQQLRWSSPHLLGDPFELDHRSSSSFDPHKLLSEVVHITIAMIFSPTNPQGSSPLLSGIRRWRDDERFGTPSEAQESAALMELLSKMVDLRQTDIDQMMAEWRNFTRYLRICCFSAKPDNLACWHDFANNHRGAVIRFHSGSLYTEKPGEEPPGQVEYKNIRPEVTTLKEQLNAIIYNERLKPQETFFEKLLCKSTLCNREQEWRCFYTAKDEASAKSNNDTEWFDDRPFDKASVRAIYFGAYMSVDDKKRLLDLQREHYPEVKVFQATPIPGKYEMEFIRLSK